MTKKTPTLKTLSAGTHYICTCGLSANFPLCDGSHKITEKTPKELVLGEAEIVAVCTCNHSNSHPFCDGSHKLVDKKPKESNEIDEVLRDLNPKYAFRLGVNSGRVAMKEEAMKLLEITTWSEEEKPHIQKAIDTIKGINTIIYE